MGEFTFIAAGLMAFCLLASLVYGRRKVPTAQLFDTQPANYLITMWAERTGIATPLKQTDAPQPQKITASYLVRLQADSATELSQAQGEYIRQIRADFNQRFIPMLGSFNIGAVHCAPAPETEELPRR